MCRMNTKFRSAIQARGYSVRSRTTKHGHREYIFTNVKGTRFTFHMPDCCPRCHQETGGIPWYQHAVLLRLLP